MPSFLSSFASVATASINLCQRVFRILRQFFWRQSPYDLTLISSWPNTAIELTTSGNPWTECLYRAFSSNIYAHDDLWRQLSESSLTSKLLLTSTTITINLKCCDNNSFLHGVIERDDLFQHLNEGAHRNWPCPLNEFLMLWAWLLQLEVQ